MGAEAEAEAEAAAESVGGVVPSGIDRMLSLTTKGAGTNPAPLTFEVDAALC